MSGRIRGTKKTEVDGIVFDSKKEAMRYLELKEMERQGKIRRLVRQPSFELQPRFKRQGRTIRPITYTADFQYEEGGLEPTRSWCRVVEDVKGHKTETFRLKWKMLQYQLRDERTILRLT